MIQRASLLCVSSYASLQGLRPNSLPEDRRYIAYDIWFGSCSIHHRPDDNRMCIFDSDCILDVDIWLPFSKVDGSSVGRNSTVWPMREESAAFMNYTQTPADYLTNNSQINGNTGHELLEQF